MGVFNKIGDLLGGGFIKKVGDVVDRFVTSPDEKKKFKIEFEKLIHDQKAELYKLEIEDRNSAREREIEIAKTGRTDWLMYAAGITGLGTFILMVCAVIFMPDVTKNSLFHQLMGIIEGVALTVFAYYFGTSKSSQEKTKILERKP